jgi:hypothetical protein
MLKWGRWVVWERKKDVYFLKHPDKRSRGKLKKGHEEHEEKIKDRYYPVKLSSQKERQNNFIQKELFYWRDLI